jgi:hypothetical protein
MSRRLRKKIHKWLEEQDPIRKQSLLESIIEKLEIEVETEQNSTAVMSRKRKRILNMTAALAICAAVFLIVWLLIALIDKGEKPPFNRYCLSSELKSEPLDTTVKEYCVQNSMDCLYLNWYDTAYYETYRFFMKEDTTDTVYLHEYMMDLETGDEIEYYIMDRYTDVDTLTKFIDLCSEQRIINSTELKWSYTQNASIGYFIYDDYKYILTISYPSSEEILFDVVEQMLETARA